MQVFSRNDIYRIFSERIQIPNDLVWIHIPRYVKCTIFARIIPQANVAYTVMHNSQVLRIPQKKSKVSERTDPLVPLLNPIFLVPAASCQKCIQVYLSQNTGPGGQGL